MNFLRKIILIFLLTILLIYVSNISNIPDSVLLFKGEQLNLKTAFRNKYRARRKQKYYTNFCRCKSTKYNRQEST